MKTTTLFRSRLIMVATVMLLLPAMFSAVNAQYIIFTN